MTCPRCHLAPCACDYINDLAPGRPFAWLADTVVEQLREPLPHRAACPCPRCWSDRARSWDEWSAIRRAERGAS